MLGINAVAYYNSGSHGTPSWQPITAFESVNVAPAYDKADANSRASRVKKSAKTMLGIAITGRLKKKPGDDGYELIMDALQDDTVLDLMICDAPHDQDGMRGWRADFQVNAATEDQGSGVVMYEDLTIDIADSDNPVYAVEYTTTGGLDYIPVD